MEQLPLLDIMIGLLLIYTLLSLLSSELTEFAVTILQWRTRRLKRAIMILLGESLDLSNDPRTFKHTITGKLYSSSSMTAIAQYFDQPRIPFSPLPAPLFAEALLDILQSLPNAPQTRNQQAVSATPLTKLLITVESAPEISPQLKANLRRLIDRSRQLEPDPQQQITQLKQEIARWFSQAMRNLLIVSKHDFKTISFLVSLAIVVAVNADTLYLIRRISENTAMRAIVIQNATQIQSCQKTLNSPGCVAQLSALMESSTMPIGWNQINRQQQFSRFSGGSFLRAIGGWLLSGIAVSMGSRFWLQLLNRFVQFLRGGFLKPDAARSSTRSTTSSGKYRSSYDLR